MASLSATRSNAVERLLLRTFGLLIPLVALWLLVAPTYSAAVFAASEALLSLDPSLTVAIADNNAGVPTVYDRSQTAEQPVFRFDRVGLFYNAIVLLALLLATPGWRWPRRAARLGVGVGLLAATHVAFVAVQTKAQFVNLGLIQPADEFAYLVNWGAVLFGPIGEGLFPLAIALGLGWRAWAETLGLRLGIKAPSKAVRRNAPCPCGSGAKYKRCCGRS